MALIVEWSKEWIGLKWSGLNNGVVLIVEWSKEWSDLNSGSLLYIRKKYTPRSFSAFAQSTFQMIPYLSPLC